MNFNKRYRDWQIACIDKCNEVYDTDFTFDNIDKDFEVCEYGAIHVYGGGWYESLIPFDDEVEYR